jgi:hypothetical protein
MLWLSDKFLNNIITFLNLHENGYNNLILFNHWNCEMKNDMVYKMVYKKEYKKEFLSVNSHFNYKKQHQK